MGKHIKAKVQGTLFDKVARLHELHEMGDPLGRATPRLFEGETRHVSSLAYSPNGGFILSGGSAVRLWELRTGQCLRTFEGHTQSVTSVAFSPDGRFALSGSGDLTIKLWEIDWDYEYDPDHDPVLKRYAKQNS